MIKEGQYHECSNCHEYWTDRTYITIRKYKWDFDKGLLGKGNPRIWQPIG